MDVHEFLIMIKGWSILSVGLRLAFSLIAGTLIGLDRSMKRRGAGIKTHVLVCLGSALVMMTGQFIIAPNPMVQKALIDDIINAMDSNDGLVFVTYDHYETFHEIV